MRARVTPLVLLVLAAMTMPGSTALAQDATPIVEATPSNLFSPGTVTITPGQHVRFLNPQDGSEHSFEISNGQAFAAAGDHWDFTQSFGPGTYVFWCSLHGSPDFGMRGELVVTAPPPPAPPATPANPTPAPSPTTPTGGGPGTPTSAPRPSGPTRHPLVGYDVDHWWEWSDTGTSTPTLLRLLINRPRTTVRVSCRGRGCPFRVRTQVIRGRRVELSGWFRRAPMATGTRIRILLLKRGHIGQSLDFRLRHEAAPRLTKRCVPPGSRQPARRCT